MHEADFCNSELWNVLPPPPSHRDFAHSQLHLLARVKNVVRGSSFEVDNKLYIGARDSAKTYNDRLRAFHGKV
jgi:hypothetical protein